MEELVKTTVNRKVVEEEFSFKNYFVPFTTAKAVTWIVLIGVIVYANMLFNGFVWDDKIYILENIDVKTLNLAYLFGPNTWNNGLYYRPLTAVYFSLLYALFNLTPFFYHLLQVIFHITDSVFLFFIFKKFFPKQLSFFLSLLFLAHPMQVESVAFIAATLSPLSFLFGALALLLSFSDAIHPKKALLIFFFLSISILIKETGVLFFFFVLLYRMLFRFNKKEITIFFIVDILLGLIYLFFRYFVGKVSLTTAKGTIVPIAGLNFIQRMENIPAIVFYYLKTFIYPAQLAIDQQWIVRKLTFSNFFLPLLLDVLFFLMAIFFGIYLHKKRSKLYKPFVFFFLWFLLALGFHVQIFPLDMTVADRFFYFPMAGLVGMIGVMFVVLGTFYKRKKHLNASIFILAISIIVLLTIRTMIRNVNWHDEITLYSHDLRIYDSMNDENNLGNDYISLQNYQEALTHFKQAAIVMPTELDYYNIGYTYQFLGNFQKAKVYYQKSLTYNKYPVDQHTSILLLTSRQFAWVYIHLREYKKAVIFLNYQLTLYPKDSYLWKYLAMSDYMIGDRKDALKAVIKAKTLMSTRDVNVIFSEIYNKEPLSIIKEINKR